MDNTKLNDLAGRAMGWELKEFPACKFWVKQDGFMGPCIHEWNPSTCADDALMLLEKVVVGSACEGWNMEVRTPNGKRRFAVDCGGCWGNADTAPLAMTLCALRAAGIPETEITDALK